MPFGFSADDIIDVPDVLQHNDGCVAMPNAVAGGPLGRTADIFIDAFCSERYELLFGPSLGT